MDHNKEDYKKENETGKNTGKNKRAETGVEQGTKSGRHMIETETENRGGVLEEPSAASTCITNAEQERASKKQEIPQGGGHTEEEYFALPDDLRVELIDGVFYAMAPPAKLHQKVAFEIARQFEDCIEKNGETYYLYIAPSDVALGDKKNTIVQPDVYVHCDREKEKRTGPHRGSPDFVVEVLSPSNPENDLWRKRELYKRHHIREYWIINPLAKKIYVFDFEKGNDPEEYSFGDNVPVLISKGTCTVDFNRINQKIQLLLEEE